MNITLKPIDTIVAGALIPTALASVIGEGWKFAEDRDSRSALLGFITDYSKVTLSTEWLQGEKSVDDDTRRDRILANTTHTVLNTDNFLYLWNKKEKIPDAWKKSGYITFDGDDLFSPGGHRSVLCLCCRDDLWDWFWIDSQWFWFCQWLGHDIDSVLPSAMLAN